jgi:hypothetical protein
MSRRHQEDLILRCFAQRSLEGRNYAGPSYFPVGAGGSSAMNFTRYGFHTAA